MATVQEFELEQKISDFVHFVRNYSVIRKGNFKVVAKREKAVLTCVKGEVNLDFEV
jgi:hypothetical protein